MTNNIKTLIQQTNALILSIFGKKETNLICTSQKTFCISFVYNELTINICRSGGDFRDKNPFYLELFIENKRLAQKDEEVTSTSFVSLRVKYKLEKTNVCYRLDNLNNYLIELKYFIDNELVWFDINNHLSKKRFLYYKAQRFPREYGRYTKTDVDFLKLNEFKAKYNTDFAAYFDEEH